MPSIMHQESLPDPPSFDQKSDEKQETPMFPLRSASGNWSRNDLPDIVLGYIASFRNSSVNVENLAATNPSSRQSLQQNIQPTLSRKNDEKTPLILGFQAPQGFGKSYMTAVLESWFNGNTTSSTNELANESTNKPRFLALSMDDFYHPHAKLETMRGNFYYSHRGNPGTHDIEAMEMALKQIQKRETCVNIPVYDKTLNGGAGDRAGWREVDTSELELVLFEGWCAGFLPSKEVPKTRDGVPALSGLLQSRSLTENGFNQPDEQVNGVFLVSPEGIRATNTESHPEEPWNDVDSALRDYHDRIWKPFLDGLMIAQLPLGNSEIEDRDIFHWFIDWRIGSEKVMNPDQVRDFCSVYEKTYEKCLPKFYDLFEVEIPQLRFLITKEREIEEVAVLYRGDVE